MVFVGSTVLLEHVMLNPPRIFMVFGLAPKGGSIEPAPVPGPG